MGTGHMKLVGTDHMKLNGYCQLNGNYQLNGNCQLKGNLMETETQVMRALLDVNRPKFLKDDLLLFQVIQFYLVYKVVLQEC